jgi:hypothetical protein
LLYYIKAFLIKQTPFRNLLKCGKCGCAITSGTQKGHNYYRCAKKKDKHCSQKYIREEALTRQISDKIQKISLPPAWAEWMLAELNREEAEAAQAGAVFAQNLKAQIKELEGKLDLLLDAHLDGTISREEYTAKKEKLITEKAELSEKLKDFERNGNHLARTGPTIHFSGSTSQNYRFARKSRRGTGFSQKNWLEPRFAHASDLL